LYVPSPNDARNGQHSRSHDDDRCDHDDDGCDHDDDGCDHDHNNSSRSVL
jgi:hypothetical protein